MAGARKHVKPVLLTKWSVHAGVQSEVVVRCELWKRVLWLWHEVGRMSWTVTRAVVVLLVVIQAELLQSESVVECGVVGRIEQRR